MVESGCKNFVAADHHDSFRESSLRDRCRAFG
jgi:hypothetical protein